MFVVIRFSLWKCSASGRLLFHRAGGGLWQTVAYFVAHTLKVWQLWSMILEYRAPCTSSLKSARPRALFAEMQGPCYIGEIVMRHFDGLLMAATLCVLLQCHEMALSSHEEIVKVLSELQNVSLPLLLLTLVNFIGLSFIIIMLDKDFTLVTCVIECVCLSVWYHTTELHLTKFSVHVTCGRCSVLLWRRYDTLCTSDFVYDAMFRVVGPMARHVVHS